MPPYENNPRRPRFSRLAVTAVAVLLMISAACSTGGCTAPQATVNVLAVAEEAVRANLRADAELSSALDRQSREQQAALDRAFLADFRALAAQNGGQVPIADIEQGKAVYDRQLAEILASREAVSKLFANKRRTQQAAMDLIQKARQLSTAEIQLRDELQQIQQQAGALLQSAFPSLVPARGDAGAEGGNQP